MLGIDLKRHCELVNENIDQILQNLQFEDRKLSSEKENFELNSQTYYRAKMNSQGKNST